MQERVHFRKAIRRSTKLGTSSEGDNIGRRADEVSVLNGFSQWQYTWNGELEERGIGKGMEEDGATTSLSKKAPVGRKKKEVPSKNVTSTLTT